MRSVGQWIRDAGELVLPRVCGGCARVGTWWCARCSLALDREPHGFDVDGPAARVRVHALAPYRGAAGSALVAMKERGAAALRAPLAEALARSVRGALDEARARDGPVVIVPVPSRPSAVRSRGADVVAELARACADELGGDVRSLRCLVHRRAVADQASLDVVARAANLAGALRVRPVAVPLLAGRTVVVVDDVLTTGATLAEAVRAVNAAPVRERVHCVGGASVAAAGVFGERLVARAGDH